MLCAAVFALVVIVRAWDCAPGYAGPSQCNHGGCFGHIVQHGTPVDNDCSNNGVWHEWGPGGTRGSGYFQWERCTYPDGHFAKCCNCWKVQDDLDFSSVAEIVGDARNAINSTASLRGSLRQSPPETQTRNVATLPNDGGTGNSSSNLEHLNDSVNTSTMNESNVMLTLETACPGCHQCSVQGQNCGKQHWWSRDVPCCGGYRCDNVLGGQGKKCVREHPACAPENGPCGGPGRQTLDCCGGMQCTRLFGGSEMQCVKSHPSCVARGQACGGPGRQTLTCCDGMQCRALLGGSEMKCS